MADDQREPTNRNSRVILLHKPPAWETDRDEESCPAFGYLKGTHKKALMVEFRFESGHSECFSYRHLSACRYDLSGGLMLKFTSDVTSLVLIHGRNLDVPLNQGAITLTDQGFQQHRILWVQEMGKKKGRRATAGSPIIDRIQVAEFESQEELRAWLQRVAPAFVRRESQTSGLPL